MSHYIDTTQAPHGGFGRLSTRQLVEIIIGIAAVIALGIAAFALVNNNESSVVELAAPSAGQAAPQAQSVVGTDNLVTHSALDPFETQLATGVDATVGSPPLAMITHSALDPFETQLATGVDFPIRRHCQ